MQPARRSGAIPPVVRHLILCDEVLFRTETPGKVDLQGLVTAITSNEDPPYPLLHAQLCVFIQVTNGRGQATVEVRIREEDMGWVAATPRRSLPFSNDPLPTRGLLFRMRGVPFPRPGLYSVEFVVSGEVIATEPLLAR